MEAGDRFVGQMRRAWDDGDAVLPVDQRLPPPAKAQVLDAMRPSWIVTANDRARVPHAQPVEPGDALVMATSGTTGAPKGVVLTHRALEASAIATSSRLGVDPGRHRWLACLPLSHIGGLSVITRSLLTGTACTVLAGFDKDEVTAHAGGDVFVSLVATALRRVDPELFHTIVLGGSAPPAGLPANAVTTYGMTETGSGVVYDGVPLDGVEVDVDTATGEIRLRGPMLLRAYRDGTVPFAADGWFVTGDAGSIDAGGRLRVAGRIGDLIITGGENVWPAPVEAAIAAHPKVREVAVAGLPDPEWGQRVVAWVVPADGTEPPTLRELRDAVAETVAPFASPKQLVIVDALPKTGIGKVRRDHLTAP